MAAPPYTPEITVSGGQYFPPPYSMDPLPPVFQHGLLAVGFLAICSVGATLTLIGFILWRLITWRLHYDSFLGYNQYVLLVLNLLIADMQQSCAFLFSFHWVRFNRILAPSSPCFAQAWLLHSGDVSSGFFVLAIAIHTFVTAVQGKRIGHKTFTGLVLFIWCFAYFLTGLGVGLHGSKYFVRAGAWCWVSEAYESDRLGLHYIWVFLVQFGTVIIYVITFFMLRRKTNELFEKVRQGHNANMTTILAINRITKLMTLYPCVYVLLTLPLSAGRMWSYAHGGASYSDAYACVAGALITSCGWVDSLLYTLTRQRLLQDTMPGGAGSGRRSQDAGSLGITHTRTVTIEGGHTLDSLEPKGPRVHSGEVVPDYGEVRPQSPTGSIDPMINNRSLPYGRYMGFRAMIEQGQLDEERSEEDREKDDQLAELPIEMPAFPHTWPAREP